MKYQAFGKLIIVSPGCAGSLPKAFCFCTWDLFLNLIYYFLFYLALVMLCGHFAYVLSRVSVCTTVLRRSCQSPVHSDQVLLDIPSVEGVMFSIIFTYMEILDATRDFWFSGAIQNTLKSSANVHYTWQSIAMAVDGLIAIPVWFPLLVSTISSLLQHWASSITGKEHAGWSQLKPIAVFKIVSLVVQFLYSVLGWTVCSLPPCWSG